MLPGLERRHHDDGHVAARGILANAAAHIEAVEPGHDDVEQHEIDAELKLREPFDAVAGGFDVVPQPLDEHLRDPANAVVVVDDEHALAAEARWRMRALDGRIARRPARCSVQPTSALRIASMPDSSCDTIGVDLLERALARGLDELGARARDGIGADDGDAALQRVGRAIQRLAIAARGGLADGFHLARALAHERIDELRDEPARPARLEAAQVPSDFAGGIGWYRDCSPSTVCRLPSDCSRSSVSLQNPTSCSAVRSDANSSVSCSVWRSQSRTTFSYSWQARATSPRSR